MNQKLSLWYDKEGDYLEVTLKRSTDTYFQEVKKDYALIIDTKTKTVVGYAVFNFIKHQHTALELPFTA